MKILIANYEFPPLGGGASKVSYELAKNLVRAGHDVIALTSRLDSAPKVDLLDGIIVHRVWSWRKSVHDCGLTGAVTYLVFALPRLRSILKTEDVDVVHYFFGLPTGLLSLYSCLIAGRPYVVSLRGSDVPLYDMDSQKLVWLHRLMRPFSHYIWRNAARVFAVSSGLRDLAVRSFPNIAIDVVYNGVEVAEQNGDSSERAASTPGQDGPVRIVCVSRLIPRKGIADLLIALSMIKDVSFEATIIGTGPSEGDLRALSQSLEVDDRVTLTGYCSPQVVQDWYRRSDIFVLPTHSDAFANVILEAMAAGLPVIACSVGGVPEAVVDGTTGRLVPPRRPLELAEAIRDLASCTQRRRALGRAGRERVQNLFSWRRNTQTHIAIYEDAVSNNKRKETVL